MNNQLLKLSHALDRIPLTAYERAEYQAIVSNASEMIEKQHQQAEGLKQQIEGLKRKIELLENAKKETKTGD